MYSDRRDRGTSLKSLKGLIISRQAAQPRWPKVPPEEADEGEILLGGTPGLGGTELGASSIPVGWEREPRREGPNRLSHLAVVAKTFVREQLKRVIYKCPRSVWHWIFLAHTGPQEPTQGCHIMGVPICRGGGRGSQEMPGNQVALMPHWPQQEPGLESVESEYPRVLG